LPEVEELNVLNKFILAENNTKTRRELNFGFSQTLLIS